MKEHVIVTFTYQKFRILQAANHLALARLGCGVLGIPWSLPLTLAMWCGRSPGHFPHNGHRLMAEVAQSGMKPRFRARSRYYKYQAHHPGNKAEARLGSGSTLQTKVAARNEIQERINLKRQAWQDDSSFEKAARPEVIFGHSCLSNPTVYIQSCGLIQLRRGEEQEPQQNRKSVLLPSKQMRPSAGAARWDRVRGGTVIQYCPAFFSHEVSIPVGHIHLIA